MPWKMQAEVLFLASGPLKSNSLLQKVCFIFSRPLDVAIMQQQN